MRFRPTSAAVFLPLLLLGLLGASAIAGDEPLPKFSQEDKFRQLEEILPTPNVYRTASGAPGHRYWQQQVDYEIDVRLEDPERRLTGSERITYTNNSPDTLRYLWVQIDPNIYSPTSQAVRIQEAPRSLEGMSPGRMKRLLKRLEFDGSADITRVEDANGRALDHTIVDTMMRIDLPRPLGSGETFVFEIDWTYIVNRDDEVSGRTAAEWFEEDGNYIYEIAQWFPRLAQYTDARGWHNKQFLGRGEFSLEFGDYVVRITVPDDHIVAATGVLQNPEEALTYEQRQRLREAEDAEEAVFIVTPEEAEANESTEPEGEKTWVFAAENVRDFAWASSRKFIWDAVRHDVMGNDVWAMSFYPNEGEPLWSRYSTHAIVHTLDVYSRFAFPYPYPTAISVNGPVGGMEYPMICFNGPRPEPDGTYSKRTKYGLISVIIHEVGHFYFPMIVNSDERQWTWMDEGINSFLQHLAEQEWEEDYPSRRGDPRRIIPYMRSENQVPIMTNSESILQFGANAYAKPATALMILRETIIGRELFDFAFKEYSRRWMFKNPQPADLFRTLEDASGVDLDWFWRGWFYTTDHVDIAIEGVRLYETKTGDLDRDAEIARARRAEEEPPHLTVVRNRPIEKRVDRFPHLLDFYNEYDELDVTWKDREAREKMMERLEGDEADYFGRPELFYVVDFANKGGLVMPLILEITYEDGAVEDLYIPAEIWRKDNENVSKMIVADQPIEKIVLDPRFETADIDTTNNTFPPEPVRSRFDLEKREDRPNPMQVLEQKPGDEDLVTDELTVEEEEE